MAALNLTVETLSGSKLSLEQEGIYIFAIQNCLYVPVMLGVSSIGGGHESARGPKVGGAGVGSAVVMRVIRRQATTPASQSGVSTIKYFRRLIRSKYFHCCT